MTIFAVGGAVLDLLPWSSLSRRFVVCLSFLGGLGSPHCFVTFRSKSLSSRSDLRDAAALPCDSPLHAIFANLKNEYIGRAVLVRKRTRNPDGLAGRWWEDNDDEEPVHQANEAQYDSQLLRYWAPTLSP